MVALVEEVAGLNAQTKRGPAVGLWTRSTDLDLRELDQHLLHYDLVRANLLRATVHLVTRRQFLTWRQALQPTLQRAVKQYCRGLLDRVDEAELLDAGRDLLARHDGLTRAQIGRGLHPRFSHAEPADLGFAIRMLLPVVEKPAPSSWNAVGTRYVLADQVMDWQPASPQDGRHDLCRSFHRAFGPAQPTDFTYWSGVTGITTIWDEHSEDPATTAHSNRSGDRRSIVLPEFDNIYFCRKSSPAPLYQAKKRPDFQPARMPGSLIHDHEVVATWVAAARTAPVLTEWKPPSHDTRREWKRFTHWYLSNET